jgi:tetratricopeptide (TPR) repeat protein
LSDAIKPLGIGAGVALFAYLVGAIMELLWAAPLQRLGVVGRAGLRAINVVVMRRLNLLSDEETVVFGLCHSFSAREYITGHASEGDSTRDADLDLSNVRALASTPRMASQVANYLHADIVSAISEELDVAATRLLGDKQAQFEIYDRLRSEAEFRIAIAPPVGALIYLLIHNSLTNLSAALIAALIAGVFVVQARNRRRAAGDRMADFLLVGDVKAPSLDQLQDGRFTFAALEAGDVRIPREPAPTRGASPRTSPRDENILGVPFRVRFTREVGEVVSVFIETAVEIVWAGWSAIRFACGLPRRVALACLFLFHDLIWNGGTVLRTAWSLGPAVRANDPAARLALGDAYRDSGYYARARRMYESLDSNMTAIGRMSDLDLEVVLLSAVRRGVVGWLPELVNLYAEHERFETAKLVCEEVIASGAIEANIPLGDVLRAMGKSAEAERIYKVAADAGIGTGFARIGEMMFRQGRDKEAEPILRKAIGMGSKSALVPLGDLLWAGGDKQGAIDIYRDARDAGVVRAAERLEKFGRAEETR